MSHGSESIFKDLKKKKFLWTSDQPNKLQGELHHYKLCSEAKNGL